MNSNELANGMATHPFSSLAHHAEQAAYRAISKLAEVNGLKLPTWEEVANTLPPATQGTDDLQNP